MVNRFFSGKFPESSDSIGELDNYEIYHNFMGAYPAYTIEHIETELSWREIKVLLDYWEKDPPMSISIKRIENMLKKKLGYEIISTKPNNSDNLKNQIEQMGWAG